MAVLWQKLTSSLLLGFSQCTQMIGNSWECFGMGVIILTKSSPLGSVRLRLFSINCLMLLSGFCYTTAKKNLLATFWMTFLLLTLPLLARLFIPFVRQVYPACSWPLKILMSPSQRLKLRVLAKSFSSWGSFSIRKKWKQGCPRTRSSASKLLYLLSNQGVQKHLIGTLNFACKARAPFPAKNDCSYQRCQKTSSPY